MAQFLQTLFEQVEDHIKITSMIKKIHELVIEQIRNDLKADFSEKFINLFLAAEEPIIIEMIESKVYPDEDISNFNTRYCFKGYYTHKLELMKEANKILNEGGLPLPPSKNGCLLFVNKLLQILMTQECFIPGKYYAVNEFDSNTTEFEALKFSFNSSPNRAQR